MVAWYFPPDGGAGSQRPASFSSGLPGLGWETTVVTRGEDHERGRWEARDESLLSCIGPEAAVLRVSEESPLDNSSPLLEREITNKAGALCQHVVELAVETNPDIILLTMSPFCLSSVMTPIQERTNCRFVLDLRDPWALDYWPVHASSTGMQAQHGQMAEAVARADGIIMNTVAARSELLSMFRDVMGPDPERRVEVITNGYTSSDFKDACAEPDREKLVITHTGTFHCEHIARKTLRGSARSLFSRSRIPIDRSGRTPLHLLRAAVGLKDTDPEVHDDLCFRFIGDLDDHLVRCVDESGIPDKVVLEGYLPHDRSVDAMCSAGALFLPGASLPDGVEDLIVPGKTYEYLASCRPIIGALPPGDATRLLERTAGTYLCDPCSEESIRGALLHLHADWKSGDLDDLASRRSDLLLEFERGLLVEHLAGFLDLVKSLPPSRDVHDEESRG